MQKFLHDQEERQDKCLSIVENKCDEDVEIAFKKKKFKTLYTCLLEIDDRKYKFRKAETDSHHDRIQNDIEYVNNEVSKPKLKKLQACCKYLATR